MNRSVLVALVALAGVGLTACMGDGSDERRAAALVSVTGTGGQPFHGGFPLGTTQIRAGSWQETSSFVVPAKKLLVIEHVTAFVVLPSGQEPFWTSLETTANGVWSRHRLDKLDQYANAGHFILSQAVTLYADPGSTVILTVSRAPHQTGAGSFVWSVSGYLVDA